MKLKSALVLPVLFVLFGWPFRHHAIAATLAPAPGITISPASQQVNVQSNEVQHPLQYKITNNENSPQNINLTTQDFNTLNETGGLFFVGANPTALQKKYGLADWLTLPQTTVTLPPKQTVGVTMFILNQSSMAPGGHYGALMLSIAGSSPNSKGKNKVAVQPIASSLLFVDKVGGDTHILKLTDVYATHNIFALPSSITLRFRNDGNTHLIPRGVAIITDSGGKVVSKGVINESSSIVLPESYRRFSVPLNKISSFDLPGKYTLRVDFRFDGYSQFRSYQTSLFLLTPIGLLIISVTLGAVAACLYYLFKNQKSKKRI